MAGCSRSYWTYSVGYFPDELGARTVAGNRSTRRDVCDQQEFGDDVSKQSLYDSTRGNWRIGEESRSRAKIALGIADDVVRTAYSIDTWGKADDGRATRAMNHGDTNGVCSVPSVVDGVSLDSSIKPSLQLQLT